MQFARPISDRNVRGEDEARTTIPNSPVIYVWSGVLIDDERIAILKKKIKIQKIGRGSAGKGNPRKAKAKIHITFFASF